ncbi:TIGR02281 family clan AA aspartic protease [Sphingomonas sp. LaA6.9]|uniref:retropepsin-like aspartic protease family protein n=1 Tax=Sphingomonas sp. LaA6.9 TaxID=2919914 RepID=UPI001F4F7C3A|nr:TIGR02281 family clan AA aspartic protease [Sphingomonas sp. LaA6.9]MCJ8158779.1 TIGR02281 family clan AA aspartic protease [Sphingomonas sp. LaA6.9]
MMRLVFLICLGAIALLALMPGGPTTPALRPGQTGQAANVVSGHLVADAAPPRVEQAGNGIAEVVLRRASDSHFYAEAQVNGAAVRFLVDSGASAVVLTRADAQKAGIGAQAGEFTARAMSANGEVKLKPVMLDRLAIGPVSATNVKAMVAENDLGVSLLGQSFLSRVAKVEITEGEMRLR